MMFSHPDWRALLWSLAGLVGAFALASLVHEVIFRIARRFIREKQTVLAQALLSCEKPARRIVILLLELAVLSFLPLRANVQSAGRHVLGIGLIVATAWLLIAMVDVVEAILSHRYGYTLFEIWTIPMGTAGGRPRQRPTSITHTSVDSTPQGALQLI